MSRLLLASLVVMWAFFGMAERAHGDERVDSGSASALARIQSLFSQMEIAGNAYNSGGGGIAASSALSSGCAMLAGSDEVRALMQAQLADRFGHADTRTGLAGFARQQLQGASTHAIDGGASMACAALSGQEIGAGRTLADALQDQITAAMVSGTQALARNSGLPFMGQLELETSLERDEIVSTVTTVQPIWTDRDGFNVIKPRHKPVQAAKHHVFTQASWRRIEGEDTLNTGVAYRNLNDTKTMLWGVNAFFDHGFEKNHNRMSLGADIRTSLLGLSANRYLGLSDWRSSDLYTEERAASGWDLEVNGQVPDLPSWTASLKGYVWDGTENLPDDLDERPDRRTYGYIGSLEYAPVPALAVRAGLRNESGADPSAEFALRFNLAFNQPLALQFKPRMQLASVEERVYEKVSRENTIRVKKRRKDAGILTVLESIGANTVSGSAGVQTISTGQSVGLPATLTVANTVGAVTRLRFNDGAILTAGQNTQVLIEIDSITLITGSAQYTSGGVSRIINVPGATITLNGTDIDMVSDGALTTVRVREGSITVAGTTAGTQTLTVGEMAQASAGTVTPVVTGSVTYDAHTDQVSAEIDRAASPIVGQKVAPYPAELPRVLTPATTAGQTLVVGLPFNTPVSVAGGPPRLAFTINGTPRTMSLSGGSGTKELQFSYTLQIGDIGATDIVVTEFDLNGANVTGDGKTAVTTIADATVAIDEISGATPSLSMNFQNNTYSLLGATYNSLSAFLTAAGGTFSRNSSGTYINAAGTVQTAATNTPRFDHDPITLQPRGLLIEEPRTNYVTHSEAVSNAAWSGYYLKPPLSATTDPLGYTAVRMTMPDIGAGPGGEFSGLTISNAGAPVTGDFTISFRARFSRTNMTNVQIQISDNVTVTSSEIYRDGQLVGTGAVISGLIPDTDWHNWEYRAKGANRTPAFGCCGNRIFQFRENDPAVATVDISRIQVEAAGFATSYIPTTGTQAARDADILTVPTSGWLNTAAGTMYTAARIANVDPLVNSGTAVIDDGSVNNAAWLGVDTARRHNITIFSGAGGVKQFEYIRPTPFTLNNDFEQALAYANNDAIAAIDGVLSPSDNAVSIPINPSILRIGNRRGGGEPMNGQIARFEYYPSRLTDTEIQTLTTP